MCLTGFITYSFRTCTLIESSCGNLVWFEVHRICFGCVYLITKKRGGRSSDGMSGRWKHPAIQRDVSNCSLFGRWKEIGKRTLGLVRFHGWNHLESLTPLRLLSLIFHVGEVPQDL